MIDGSLRDLTLASVSDSIVLEPSYCFGSDEYHLKANLSDYSSMHNLGESSIQELSDWGIFAIESLSRLEVSSNISTKYSADVGCLELLRRVN